MTTNLGSSLPGMQERKPDYEVLPEPEDLGEPENPKATRSLKHAVSLFVD